MNLNMNICVFCWSYGTSGKSSFDSPKGVGTHRLRTTDLDNSSLRFFWAEQWWHTSLIPVLRRQTGGSLSLTPTWSKQQVPGQPVLHRETLSLKKQTNKQKRTLLYGWWDGSAVKSSCCFCRGSWIKSPASIGRFPIICNSSSRATQCTFLASIILHKHTFS